MTELAWIGLGANLGEPRDQIDGAIELLAADPRLEVLRRSELIWTAPVGGPAGQPPYLNGVAELRWEGTARELLLLLQAVEARFGRERGVPDGPRTLDLDLLLLGPQVLEEPDLTLPHPRMAGRTFVLEPLASLEPGLHVPGTGATVGALLDALTPAPAAP